MKLIVFCVHDLKANVYMQPWCAINDAVAIRQFAASVNPVSLDRSSPISATPEDFTLFRCGEFDDSTGLVTPLDAPVSLGNGVQFKRV